MTNREILKLYATEKPELIIDLFYDFYSENLSYDERIYLAERTKYLPKIFQDMYKWLDEEQDKNLFYDADIEELLELSKIKKENQE